MQKKIRDRIERLAAERPVWLAFLVFLSTALVVVPVSIPFWSHAEFPVNVMSEAFGTLFDLLIIGWLLLWLNRMADRRQRKTRYQEEIEDALGWRSPVASHRIVSNVRRLNRSGVTSELELPEAYLKGASLEKVKLESSNLWGAYLEEATLREADLTSAILAGANFEEADLESARLESADLRGANLRGADMERAHLEHADLRGANLEDADLQYAALNNIGLERASLSGTNLRGATLTEADLERATLREASLTAAQLEGACLDGADFTDAQLREADLRGASLKATIFAHADLSGVQVTDEDVAAFGEAATLYEATLDEGLRRRLEEMHPHLFEPPEEETADEPDTPDEANTPPAADPPAGDGQSPAGTETGDAVPMLATGRPQGSGSSERNGRQQQPSPSEPSAG